MTASATKQAELTSLSFVRQLWRLLPKRLRRHFWKWWGGVFPYQKLTYKGRVLAWGRDRTATYRLLFPTAPLGKTILDVGCHLGFYCFQAASDGARYCLGIDTDGRRIAKGRALILKQGIPNIDLITADVRRYDFNQHFDIVLCLNLLQHMQTIDKVDELLDHLHRVATERLILIVPLTTSPQLAFEYAVFDNVPYVLLSEPYFRAKYGECVQILALPPLLYGPNRVAVVVDPVVPPSDSSVNRRSEGMG